MSTVKENVYVICVLRWLTFSSKWVRANSSMESLGPDPWGRKRCNGDRMSLFSSPDKSLLIASAVSRSCNIDVDEVDDDVD